MAHIRPYRKSDFDATAHICRETLASSLLGSEPAWRLAPYLWTHQYTHLSPSTCFVLDDGSGAAVGYCIGCPDVAGFVAGYDGYVREVLDVSGEVSRPSDVVEEREPWWVDEVAADDKDNKKVVNETSLAQTAYNPKWLLVEGNEDLLEAGYGATMHIDLLDAWQGKGWGRKLIEMFVEAVRDQKRDECKGIMIGVARENDKVVAFYEKMGFRLCEGGESIRMVRDV